MKYKCLSIQDYITELIEAEEKYTLYFNDTVKNIMAGKQITLKDARILSDLLKVQPSEIFLAVDSMHKIEKRYLKRKKMFDIKKKLC